MSHAAPKSRALKTARGGCARRARSATIHTFPHGSFFNQNVKPAMVSPGQRDRREPLPVAPIYPGVPLLLATSSALRHGRSFFTLHKNCGWGRAPIHWELPPARTCDNGVPNRSRRDLATKAQRFHRWVSELAGRGRVARRACARCPSGCQVSMARSLG